MNKRDAPKDVLQGSGSVGSAPVNVMPYQNMLKQAPRWLLWFSNAGPDPVNVQFTCSPDGVYPDNENTSTIVCPANHAVSAYGDGLHRYWAISAWSSTSNTCNVSWGATLDLY